MGNISTLTLSCRRHLSSLFKTSLEPLTIMKTTGNTTVALLEVASVFEINYLEKTLSFPGERFAMLTSKLALANILVNFSIERVPTTPPLIEFDPKCLLPNSKGGLPLRLRKLEP